VVSCLSFFLWTPLFLQCRFCRHGPRLPSISLFEFLFTFYGGPTHTLDPTRVPGFFSYLVWLVPFSPPPSLALQARTQQRYFSMGYFPIAFCFFQFFCPSARAFRLYPCSPFGHVGRLSLENYCKRPPLSPGPACVTIFFFSPPLPAGGRGDRSSYMTKRKRPPLSQTPFFLSLFFWIDGPS